MKTTYTKEQVRAMRDKVYGVPISDSEWDKCCDNWMKSEETAWLVKTSQE